MQAKRDDSGILGVDIISNIRKRVENALITVAHFTFKQLS